MFSKCASDKSDLFKINTIAFELILLVRYRIAELARLTYLLKFKYSN